MATKPAMMQMVTRWLLGGHLMAIIGRLVNIVLKVRIRALRLMVNMVMGNNDVNYRSNSIGSRR